MRTSGRNVGGRLGLTLAFVCALTGVAAAEIASADVPKGDAYMVTAQLVPGPSGAGLCGGDVNGQDHVDFHIGFGSDMQLTVNGASAGAFDPTARYHITVTCRKEAGQWLATTHITNQSTGLPVFQQVDHPMCGAADFFRAVAEDVIQLSAE